MAVRTLSVLGLTIILGFAISTGLGLAGPFFPEAAHAQASGATGTLVCPKTGCTASTCHGGSGVSPEVFYGKTAKATHKPAARTKAKRPSSKPATKVTSRKSRGTAKGPNSTSGKTKSAAATRKPAKKVTKKRYVCPVTGCARSTCHGTSGQSPGSFYK